MICLAWIGIISSTIAFAIIGWHIEGKKNILLVFMTMFATHILIHSDQALSIKKESQKLECVK